MAAGQTTITTLGSSPTVRLFDVLRKTNARCQIEFDQDPIYDTPRFHPPGVDGNILVRNGLSSGKVTLKARYHGLIADVLSNYTADKKLWENTAVTITDETGEIYKRCNFLSMRKMSRPKGYPNAGVNNAYMDVEIQFTRDA